MNSNEQLARRLFRFLFGVCMIGMLALFVQPVVRLSSLALELWGESYVERGKVAAAEGSYLALVSRPRLRKELRSLQPRVGDPISRAWAFITEAREFLPESASIYLNVPDKALHFFGVTMLYPRTVSVDWQGLNVKEVGRMVDPFYRLVTESEWERLVELGYTHLITEQSGKLVVVNLLKKGLD